jgi:hypothetical protein
VTALEHPDPHNLTDKSVGERILRALAGIRYGSIEITVHDGRVVQIERKERLRWDKPDSHAAR